MSRSIAIAGEMPAASSTLSFIALPSSADQLFPACTSSTWLRTNDECESIVHLSFGDFPGSFPSRRMSFESMANPLCSYGSHDS